MTINELALQQLHDDIAALTAAIKEQNELLKANKDIVTDVEPTHVLVAGFTEDALAILSATPLTVTDGGTPVQVEVNNAE